MKDEKITPTHPDALARQDDGQATRCNERPWQPWERNYSGNRVGVRTDGDWTILHILSGGAETTTSIREHEAWDLALRVSPKLAARLKEIGAENRKMRDALFKLGPQCRQANIEELREAAEEVDCGDGCTNHFYDGSCNAHECHRENTDGGCSWQRAESLRDLASALEAQAEVPAPAPKPTHPDALAKLAEIPAVGSEERDSLLALIAPRIRNAMFADRELRELKFGERVAAMQEVSRVTAEDILTLMSEARKQGQRDVLETFATEGKHLTHISGAVDRDAIAHMIEVGLFAGKVREGDAAPIRKTADWIARSFEAALATGGARHG